MGIRNKKEKSYANAENVYDKVKLDSIPKFSELKQKVDAVVRSSSWWDLYGVDWAITLFFLLLFPVSLLMLRSDSWLLFALGVYLQSLIYHSWGTRNGHLAAHGSMTRNKKWSRVLSTLFVEFIGTFSEELAYDIHIKEHHPYTNIIGIGDSSTWKMPFLPRYIYMFIAPLLLPPVTMLVSMGGLVEKRSFLGLLRYIIVAGAGLWCYLRLIMAFGNMSLMGTIAVMWVSRGIYFIPYIHVNIFQHIGLPMYSKENKPVRFYQMTSGVLNLPRNILLDYTFGHSIISCHVEHHLFPTLSDNMCLKIKPIVSKFVKESGLPYNEETYTNRLSLFINQYEKLMVNAPPITHFVGIQ